MISVEISKCVVEGPVTQGIRVLPGPADILESLFDELAPAFAHMVISKREEVKRCGCGPIEIPMHTLFEVARLKLEASLCQIGYAAVTKGASGEDVPVK